MDNEDSEARTRREVIAYTNKKNVETTIRKTEEQKFADVQAHLNYVAARKKEEAEVCHYLF